MRHLSLLTTLAFLLIALHPIRAEHNGKLQILLIGDSTTEARIPKQHQPKGPISKM